MTDFDIYEMIEAVKTQQVEIQITLEPDRTEINIQPWKPFKMQCPYGGANHDER